MVVTVKLFRCSRANSNLITLASLKPTPCSSSYSLITQLVYRNNVNNSQIRHLYNVNPRFKPTCASNYYRPTAISKLWFGHRVDQLKGKLLNQKDVGSQVDLFTQVRHFQDDRETKSLALLDNVKQVRHSPAAALILGFGGLVPFVAAPSYMISIGAFVPSIAFAQLAYGASILSFIGGIRWGLTLPQGSTQSPDWHNLGYSVTPSLVAWGALLASPTLGNLVLMGGLGLSGYMDIAMWGYPNWFKGLRFCLTFVAILSLWTSLMCSFIMDSPNPKEGQLKVKEEV